jgi:phosphatidylserine decarboxylase
MYASDVKERDKLWLRGQLYSLVHMVDDDEFAPQFVGRTAYQAYCSVTKYHCWYSPVTGTIVRHFNVSGSYYVECPLIGFGPLGQSGSERFITQTAARAIVHIQADNPDIGLMSFMGVGMAECPTCGATVKEEERFKKGDQLGMFHFGGSTYCLISDPRRTSFLARGEISVGVLLNQAIASVTHWLDGLLGYVVTGRCTPSRSYHEYLPWKQSPTTH